MTLTLEITPELEQALQASAARAGLAPDRYVLDLLQERLGPTNGAAPPVSPRPKPRCWSGSTKGCPRPPGRATKRSRRSETRRLSPTASTQKLLRLVNEVELWNARRMEAVAELSQRRGVRFPDLVKQLGLGPPAHA